MLGGISPNRKIKHWKIFTFLFVTEYLVEKKISSKDVTISTSMILDYRCVFVSLENRIRLWWMVRRYFKISYTEKENTFYWFLNQLDRALVDSVWLLCLRLRSHYHSHSVREWFLFTFQRYHGDWEWQALIHLSFVLFIKIQKINQSNFTNSIWSALTAHTTDFFRWHK